MHLGACFLVGLGHLGNFDVPFIRASDSSLTASSIAKVAIDMAVGKRSMIESSFWIKNYITVSKGDSKVQAPEDHWETRGHVAKCLKYLQMSDDSLSYSNMRGVTASSFAAGIVIESPRMLLANTH
ncbi:hypothetical protein NOF04DRAFT_1280994 [Fusarium oxysporum II5]|nr:hypothetical protein NOF04DRAFT_1280994 [Fusarium oxysporum II5]